MYGLLAVLVICGTALTLWFRLEPLLRARLTTTEPKPLAAPSENMPTDLLMEAMGYDEEWARQQTLDVMKELRAEHGSWERVRAIWPTIRDGQAN